MDAGRKGVARAVGACLALAGVVVGVAVATRQVTGITDSPDGGTSSEPVVRETRSQHTGSEDASAPVDPDMAWFAADRDTVEPARLPMHQDTYTDSVLVRISSGMWSLREGSRVTFDIPHTAARVESVIERVEELLGANRTFLGRIVGQDSPSRVVITVGDRNVFAYIGTRPESYELVGNREFGWLMSSAGMERHVDYGEPDFYVPATPRADP